MNKGFIEVKDERLSALEFLGLGRNNGIFLGHWHFAETSSSVQLDELLLSER